MNMKKTLNLLILFIFPIILSAQTFELGGSVGLSNYQGDVASSKIWTPQELNLGASIFARYNFFNTKWSLRTDVLVTNLSGNDHNFSKEEPWRTERGLIFNTSLQEVTLNLEWKFRNKFIPQKGFHPYLVAGLGIVFTNPTTNIEQSDSPDKEGRIETKNHLLIPIGVGFTYNLTNRLSLGAEVSTRQPFTDYLDGISQLGNPQRKDWYTYAALTFAYEFGADWEVSKRPKNFNK